VGSWNAGLLGYFSHRPVVNLDGLVNDRTYFENVILGHDLETYLRDEGIERLADQACGVAPTLLPYLARTDSRRLAGAFSIEAIFFHRNGEDGCPGYAVWRR
jgi:hypothetical protein